MASLALEQLFAPGVPAVVLARLREALADCAPAALPSLVEEHPMLLLALLRRAASLAPTAEAMPRDAEEACQVLGHAQSLHYIRLLALMLLPAADASNQWERALKLREAGSRLLQHLQDSDAGPLPRLGSAEATLLRLLEVPAMSDSTNPPHTWGRWLLASCGGSRWWHPELAQALAGMAEPMALPGPAGRRAAMLLTVAEGCQPGTGPEADLLRRWEREWAGRGVLRHG